MSLIVGPSNWWITLQPPTELGLQNFLFDEYFYFFWYEYANPEIGYGVSFDERDSFLFGY
jgi:hypothetical protein